MNLRGLTKALRHDDVEFIKGYIAIQEDGVNLRFIDHKTLLHHAAHWGSVEVMKYLLAHSELTPETINTVNKWGESILHGAAIVLNAQRPDPDLEVCKLILGDERFDKKLISAKTRIGETAKEIAVSDDSNSIQKLIEEAEKTMPVTEDSSVGEGSGAGEGTPALPPKDYIDAESLERPYDPLAALTVLDNTVMEASATDTAAEMGAVGLDSATYGEAAAGE